MVRVALPRGFQKILGPVRPIRRYNAPGNVCAFSTSSSCATYADTINNLKIGAHTKVLFQGFTGRQATFNAKECIEYGTKVVGGVKPGFEGEHLGLPVFPSVRTAVDKLKPDASAIYVPGNGTVAAMEEAIGAEIPLIIAVAEHIPIHDILRIHQMLKTQSKTRLVGANCPGIINTYGRCRIGFQPLPFFQEGKISIIAKSGTLSYETVAATTRAGLGQSYAISMGGDVLAGTNFVEAFQVFEHDEKTAGIIMVGEVGGTAEQDAAEWLKEYRRRTPNPKPVMALVGGIHAPRGQMMGHAGAWAAPGEVDAAGKIKILENAGVVVVDHPEKFGDGMKKLLAEASKGAQGVGSPGATQKRAFHTMRQRPRTQTATPGQNQKRTLYLKQSQAFDMLEARGIATIESPLTDDSHPIPDETPAPSKEHLLSISIDRTVRSPCIIASPSTDPFDMFTLAERFLFAYGSDGATSDAMLEKVSRHLGIEGGAQKGVANLIANLVDIFMSKEAILLETKFAVRDDGTVQVQDAKFGFDDAAFKSSGRQKDIHQLRDKDAEAREEVMAEKEGMIYVKLSGEGSLGTIVNGAGLAMNTVDALVARGGHPANFLDTGGKATSETIKAAFQCVASDARVKAIFVNIFGGLTLCDMIAKGIIMAFQDLDLKVPVVVRLRGTNEKLGQKMVRSAGA
jgi:succinyl-CoA synthetase alpha subunit